eukprot:gene11627-34335_t
MDLDQDRGRRQDHQSAPSDVVGKWVTVANRWIQNMSDGGTHYQGGTPLQGRTHYQGRTHDQGGGTPLQGGLPYQGGTHDQGGGTPLQDGLPYQGGTHDQGGGTPLQGGLPYQGGTHDQGGETPLQGGLPYQGGTHDQGGETPLQGWAQVANLWMKGVSVGGGGLLGMEAAKPDNSAEAGGGGRLQCIEATSPGHFAEDAGATCIGDKDCEEDGCFTEERNSFTHHLVFPGFTLDPIIFSAKSTGGDSAGDESCGGVRMGHDHLPPSQGGACTAHSQGGASTAPSQGGASTAHSQGGASTAHSKGGASTAQSQGGASGIHSTGGVAPADLVSALAPVAITVVPAPAQVDIVPAMDVEPKSRAVSWGTVSDGGLLATGFFETDSRPRGFNSFGGGTTGLTILPTCQQQMAWADISSSSEQVPSHVAVAIGSGQAVAGINGRHMAAQGLGKSEGGQLTSPASVLSHPPCAGGFTSSEGGMKKAVIAQLRRVSPPADFALRDSHYRVTAGSGQVGLPGRPAGSGRQAESYHADVSRTSHRGLEAPSNADHNETRVAGLEQLMDGRDFRLSLPPTAACTHRSSTNTHLRKALKSAWSAWMLKSTLRLCEDEEDAEGLLSASRGELVIKISHKILREGLNLMAGGMGGRSHEGRTISAVGTYLSSIRSISTLRLAFCKWQLATAQRVTQESWGAADKPVHGYLSHPEARNVCEYLVHTCKKLHVVAMASTQASEAYKQLVERREAMHQES